MLVSRIWIPVVSFSVILFASGCGEGQIRPEPQDTGSGVAIYAGRGADSDCIQASQKMFEWMGHQVERVYPSSITDEGLGKYELVCFPGGDMFYYAQDIPRSGKASIREFIRKGGAYVGICGGAYFAGEKVVWRGKQLPMEPLSLFRGTSRGPFDTIVPYPQYGMCKINFSDTGHPITSSQPDSAWVLYYWGPGLFADDETSVTVIGRYDKTDNPAILAFDYGKGRVFLIGTHPEFEEDSDRDGVTFCDELDDRGTDWDMMQQAVTWCFGG
jgi:glutamine amidotransferase-like uncharacterized protein